MRSATRAEIEADEMALDWSQYPNFTPAEMACNDGTPLPEDLPGVDTFMYRLQLLRTAAQFGFIISSAYRTPAYNASISSTGHDGPHTTGRAVDIVCYGWQAYKLVSLAPEFEFTGIGVKQKGDINKRFIHLDDLEDHETKGPRPWIWSY